MCKLCLTKTLPVGSSSYFCASFNSVNFPNHKTKLSMTQRCSWTVCMQVGGLFPRTENIIFSLVKCILLTSWKKSYLRSNFLCSSSLSPVEAQWFEVGKALSLHLPYTHKLSPSSFMRKHGKKNFLNIIAI